MSGVKTSRQWCSKETELPTRCRLPRTGLFACIVPKKLSRYMKRFSIEESRTALNDPPAGRAASVNGGSICLNKPSERWRSRPTLQLQRGCTSRGL